ncbi:ferrochelatase [Pontibacter cellulosilyticus]|uniref:Ferrochelatase n=1 Tax=Pontibacter cellulosilyticus TaxID=1720253 RepID=A0A923SKH4_9BACT|nr:ferrochelatase [Pontibacter cellulosilyticus]MBC5994747.1 ferrochelatase [Pontibacter cellulosilyticus]
MSKKKAGKIGVLLVNLGTPDSPNTPDVRKYLREFLLDPRVIDINPVGRYALVNGIIAPFRAPKSAIVYKQLWTERGSPLLYHGLDLKVKLQTALGDDYHVAFGMRYQSPSIKSALEELRDKSVDRIIVLPLFPQYAAASTGSVQDKVMEIVREWWVIPSINFISSFCDDPGFINAFAELGKQHMEQDNYDHVIFSYHGLPERQVLKGSDKGYCQLGACCNTYNKRNKYCYRAACFATSRLLAEKLGLREDQYTVTFQSRLLKDPWLQPYTDEVLKTLPAKGIKKVLAYSPAFVADCLETTIEVGEEFKEMFEHAGGEKWQLVESLNSNDTWVEALREMILKH